MWEPEVVDYSSINRIRPDRLLSGRTPMVIIRNFYDAKNCQAAVAKIKRLSKATFQNGKMVHVGPFLMAYATDKKKYFMDAAKARKTLGRVFSGMENPMPMIYGAVAGMFPGHSVSLAQESGNGYSQAVIRIHEKGTSVPIHKDAVWYEGKEYAVSKIDRQLSCVLHIQESESGGELVAYDKRWEKADERFRNIGFGYSPRLTESARSCRAPGLHAGDLVIMNPTYYHMVTSITGDTPRITLGMFFGFCSGGCRIVSWA